MAKNLVSSDSATIIESGENIYIKVTETGSNENGDYIKYEDGTMICWGIRNFENLAITTAWGNAYETAHTQSLGNFPQTFIDTPKLFVSVQTGVTCFPEVLNPHTSDLGTTWFWCPTSRASASFGISWQAIGKWK